MENEKIYVFDAYGTLFDVDHACKEMAIQLGDNWEKLSSIWRQKQLEYSWLHNSMNEYVSFWKITNDSLEYAMNSLSINSIKIKNELLDLYFKIGAFEEVEEVLKVHEGRPNIEDLIRSGLVQLIINTPIGSQALHDDAYLRRAALEYNIPTFTTIPGAKAAIKAIKALQSNKIDTYSLQEIHNY